MINTKPALVRPYRRRTRPDFHLVPVVLHRLDYQLRVFGFAPPQLLTVEQLRDLCNEYIRGVFEVDPTIITFGKDLVSSWQGGGR